MLSTYDLLDIHYILISIRFSPRLKDNIKIVDLVIDFLNEKINCSNSIRIQYNKSLRDNINTIYNIDNSTWHFGVFDSHYKINKPVADKKATELFLTVFKCIKLLLYNKSYDDLYKIVDSSHNFPVDLLINYNKTEKKMERFANKLTEYII